MEDTNLEMHALLQNSSKNIKKLSQFKKILVVMGNETCDLDSAVSSLTYSLLLNHQKTEGTIVIPVFNIPRVQLPVKTEVTFMLHKYGLDINSIICRDEVELQALQAAGVLQLSLVDHHALPPGDEGLAPSVVTVIDHRPPDPAWPWPQASLTLHTVGSCCSLVADRLLALAPQLLTPTVAAMLMGPILLDTACLSAAVGRATPLDHQMAEQLAAHCPTLDRQLLFAQLQAAKSDTSSLTSSQLLIKDLKVAAGIPIAGLPIKVKKFLGRTDAESATKQFREQYNAPACVVYGQGCEDGKHTRDIAVFSDTDLDAASKIVSALVDSEEPSLHLQPQPCAVPGFSLFEQLNIKASRKQVLPIVRQVGETLIRR